MISKKFSSDGHLIVHGDVLEELRAIPSESIDLIFSDPPYNIGKDFDGIHDSIDEDLYFEWCWKWINECERILKKSGSFYLMNSTQNMPKLDVYCRQIFTILSRIVWSYDSSGVQAKRYFGSLYEPILHMVKNSKEYTFNAADIVVEAKTGAKRGLIDYRKNPPQPYNNTKVPGNVWEFPRVRFKMDEYENHPSQKPEVLLERIIKASSNPGDLVLDPFGGTFSTSAVAKKLGRRTISFDKNEVYVKIGIRRLGLESDYSPSDLEKLKVRKTTNLSKKQRSKTPTDESVEQSILKFEL